MYRLARNRMTAWDCLDSICKYCMWLVHCNGDSDLQYFPLIFQWTRVSITNAHAFETAICHQSRDGWEHRDWGDMQEYHHVPQLQWPWLYRKTLDVKREVVKMGEDRNNIIDNVRFDHSWAGQCNYKYRDIISVGIIYLQAAILNL